MRDEELDALLATADRGFQRTLDGRMRAAAGLNAIIGSVEQVPLLESQLIWRLGRVLKRLRRIPKAAAAIAELRDGIERRTLSRSAALTLIWKAVDEAHRADARTVVLNRLNSIEAEVRRLFAGADERAPWSGS